MPVALETIPKTFEKSDGSAPLPPPPVAIKPESISEKTVDNESQPKPLPRADSERLQKLNNELQPSLFVKNAEWVIIHEGRRIGTPCNRFVSRVLQYSGFSGYDFLANDFDLYAQKYFKSYKAVDFKNDEKGSEIARLKVYLWSYPERTPFIMQWSGSGMHGHIAIVERIQDHLIIFQANLNKYTARKDQTTVQSLLNGFNRRALTVYSEFK